MLESRGIFSSAWSTSTAGKGKLSVLVMCCVRNVKYACTSVDVAPLEQRGKILPALLKDIAAV